MLKAFTILLIDNIILVVMEITHTKNKNSEVQKMKRKMIRVILTGLCAVCLIACGKSEEEQASEYYQEQFGMSEKDADELANALYGNGGVQTEAEPETEAAPEAEARLKPKQSSLLSM